MTQSVNRSRCFAHDLEVGALYLIKPNPELSYIAKQTMVQKDHLWGYSRNYYETPVTEPTNLLWLNNSQGFLFPDGSVGRLLFENPLGVFDWRFEKFGDFTKSFLVKQEPDQPQENP